MAVMLSVRNTEGFNPINNRGDTSQIDHADHPTLQRLSLPTLLQTSGRGVQMSFVSFPRPGIDGPEHNASLYSKLSTAASHMLNSLRDFDAESITSPRTTEEPHSLRLRTDMKIDSQSIRSGCGENPQLTSFSVNSVPQSLRGSQASRHASKPSSVKSYQSTNSISARSHLVQATSTPHSSATSAAHSTKSSVYPNKTGKDEPPLPSVPRIALSDSTTSLSHLKHEATQNMATSNPALLPGAPIAAGLSHRPQLLRSSTTSSATVGLSAEQAVPHLPTSNISAQSRRGSTATQTSQTLGINHEYDYGLNVDAPPTTNYRGHFPKKSVSSDRGDTDSFLSVSSVSASRAYLASQYSRSRTRAAPGRLGREFWMKDESATSCFSCNRAFTTFRRKHHCRVCGQIFCSSCTQQVDGAICGAPNRRVRCCRSCEESLAQHTSSEDEGDMSFWSQAPAEDARTETPQTEGIAPEAVLSPIHPSPVQSILGTPEQPGTHDGGAESYSRLASPIIADEQVHARSFLGPNGHGRRPRAFSQASRDEHSLGIVSGHSSSVTSTGLALPPVNWGNGTISGPVIGPALTSNHASSYNAGLGPGYGPGQSLSHNAGFGSSNSLHGSIHGSMHTSGYNSVQNSAHNSLHNMAHSSAHSSMHTISNYGNPETIVQAFGPTGAMVSQTSLSNNLYGSHSMAYGHDGQQYFFPLSNAQFPNSASVELNNAAIKYLGIFLEQLLRDCELDPEQWVSTLTAPILELASGLHLEINDKLSPREWVKIKRIPGGKPHDIDYINGIVFTHSLTRKDMPKQILLPRIMLITFPIEYTRNERYVSLVPVIAQEKEYLKKLVARITALKPSLLLTSSHISGLAIDMLQAEGVAVAQNIRESALFRLSRLTKADLLTSIDRLSVAPQLGVCECFEQRSYRHDDMIKTFLFFFVKQADPGRCALVRGDPEISSVIKVVLEVMAEICYSLKAETALMRDQFIMVPNLAESPQMVLSSSPFVDYGSPFLQRKTRELEDRVVELGNQLDNEESPEQAYILRKKLEFVRDKWVETSQLWESIEAAHPFMFNPSSHQNLIVLCSLVCTETATPCVGPDSQLIEFYLNTDQTLGRFVESSISQANDPCPDGCKRPMCAHYKSYVNGNGMVTVTTKKLPCKVPGLEESILMWSYCKICEQQMPVVPMSSTTWKCSMGKYLEISFYGEPMRMRASTCTHNVYRDHIRYFGWHGYALKIEYSPVALNQIVGPPRILRWNPETEVELKNSAYREWVRKLRRFWASLLDSLGEVKIEGLEEEKIELSQQRLEELRLKAETDRDESLAVIESIYQETEPCDYLSLNRFLESYQQLVDQWHSDIADFDGQFFPTERDIRRVTALHIKGLIGDDQSKPKLSRHSSTYSSTNNKPDETGSEKSSKEHFSTKGGLSNATIKHDRSEPEDEQTEKPEKKMSERPSSVVNKQISLSAANDKATPAAEKTEDATSNSNLEVQQELAGVLDRTESQNNELTGSPQSVKMKSLYGNDINLNMPGIEQNNLTKSGNRVAILAEHFEELSREFERERKREKSRLQERQRAIRQRYAHPVAEVFEDVTEAIEDWPIASSRDHRADSTNEMDHASEMNVPLELHKENRSSRTASSAASAHDTQLLTESEETGKAFASVAEDAVTKVTQIATNTGNDTDDLAQLPPIGIEAKTKGSGDKRLEENNSHEEDTKRAEPARLSIINTLANFWAERSSTRWNGMEYVLLPTEHFFTNSPVVLRESEPSSLIAFCLSLPDYVSRINDFYAATAGITNLPPDRGADTDEQNRALEQAMLRQTGTHMRYHFDRNNIKVSCKIFYSEQFDALRRKCQVDDKFVQSLSRCNTWDSTGGKSGSAFLKTLDDRLILKDLSHAEFDSFVNFAPSYFEYMSQALFHDLPTVLSKIFGVYQITIRNTGTSQQVKMYVLVMENLFYGTRFSKAFDLKGSMRNRKATETGRENEVLLDENMVEFIYESPLFVREQSKRMLRTSLYNDTLFLTKMNVMDYSLIIGLDEENSVIVAGIIDYIRTYTWDKKIESWVKTRAATGGVKEPTVVSPKQYKGRFRESMERYFVMVPDCWSQFGSF